MRRNLAAENTLSIIKEFFTDLNLSYNSAELFHEILDFCIRFTGATTGSLILVNPETNILEIKVARGLGADIKEKVKLKVGEGLTGWCVANGKPILSNNVKKDSRYIKIKDYIQSELVVPLTYEGKIIGAISVDSSKLNAFNENDLNFLEIIAPLVAQIIKNSELYEELRKRYERDEILLKIHREISKTESIQEGLQKVLEILYDNINFLRASIAVYYPDIQQIKIIVSHGLTLEEKMKGIYKKNEGIIGRVFYEKKVIVIEELSKEKDFLNRTQSRSQLEGISFVAYPIKVKDEVIGVLWFDKNYKNSSTNLKDDLDLLEFVTSFITPLIKNYISEVSDNFCKYNFHPYFLMDFDIRTQNEKVKKIIDNISSDVKTKSNLLLCIPSKLERFHLIFKILSYITEDKIPLLWDFATINMDKIEDIFTRKKQIQKILKENILILENFHLMPVILQKELLNYLKSSTLILSTNLNFFYLIDNKLIYNDLLDKIEIMYKFPSFKERRGDLYLYLDEFKNKLNILWNLKINKIEKEAKDILIENCIENIHCLISLLHLYSRVALYKQKGVITPKDVMLFENKENEIHNIEKQMEILLENYVNNFINKGKKSFYSEIINLIERKILEVAYNKLDGNKLKISNILGINRATLYKKLKGIGL